MNSKHFVDLELDDRSIHVLAANDDKPTKPPPGGGTIHTTKYCVDLHSKEILFSFVLQLA